MPSVVSTMTSHGQIEVAIQRQRHDGLNERGAVEGVKADQRITVEFAIRAFAQRPELIGHAQKELADGFHALRQRGGC